MLEVAGLSKRFGGVVALDDVSFVVPEGRVVGFLGPNGAGKTTAMRAVFGLTHPDAGGVRWRGRTIGPAARSRFGYLPEERGLYSKMQVHEQLVYLARLHGLDRDHAGGLVDGWLERVGLADRARSPLEELSHGNQQRVQLLAALVHDPELLVCDDPFGGLDPLAVDTLAEVLREQAERGVAVLFSSHQLDLVEGLCQDVVVIDRGRIVLSGSLQELRDGAEWRRAEIGFERSLPGWRPDGIPGAEVVDSSNGTIRLRVPADVDVVQLAKSADTAGRVVRFGVEPPSLSDLFREAVSR